MAAKWMSPIAAAVPLHLSEKNVNCRVAPESLDRNVTVNVAVPRSPRSHSAQSGLCVTPNRHIRRACDAKHRTRVSHSLRERDITQYPRDRDHVQLRVGQAVQQRQPVVDAGVTSSST